MRFYFIFSFLLFAFSVSAQRITISGIVTDSSELPIDLASVQIKGTINGTFTNEKGKYSLSTNAQKDSLVLVFSCLGYNTTQINLPSPEQDVVLNVKMRVQSYELEEFTVTSNRIRTNTMEEIKADQIRLAVDATGGSVESLVIVTGTGVSSTNELSSQYSVRGGNYNENIVYVNGIELYRPLLIRSSQQEGLSFINPDMTERVQFSSGGFDARYGDKMSSVLDVTYKKPETFEGGVTGSMLGGNAYVGSNSGKFSQITGFRYKRGTTLLNTLDTKGDYNPSVMDAQTFMSYDFSSKLNFSFLGNYTDNTYDFNPGNRKTSFGTMNDPKNFTVFFDGAERDRFRTLFGAATLKYALADHADISLQVSGFQSKEEETYDITGEYWMSNVMEKGEDEITGTGLFHQHARDYLNAEVLNASIVGNIGLNQNTIRWSLGIQKESIKDRLIEWELRDSMGYSLPTNDALLSVFSNLSSRNEISSNRFFGYIQDTYKYRINEGIFSITGGIRGSYWDYNKEFIFSPRVSMGFVPAGNQKITLRFATGIYYQAPFYKEFRIVETDENRNSYISLNNKIKSQRSIHFVLGGDYGFRVDNRPFKFTTELYYKKLDNLIPYTVDNVKVWYYGSNVAKGYATGIDTKLFGQFVPGTDSWLGLSLMQAKQDINGKKVPMPTDQRYNITFYYTDYAPNYDKIQLNLRAIWADGLPFSVPGEYEPKFRAPAYRRIDIGMTYRLLDEKEQDYRIDSFWRYFKNVWVGVDVFNLFDIKNVSSYSWFSDVEGHRNAVPDKLTGRQINIKLIAEF